MGLLRYYSERQSNIELLRILAIAGVIVLHYNNPTIGGGLQYAAPNNLNYLVLCFLESVNICAVDLFFMITGYFMATKYKRDIRKPIELIVQVILYRLAFRVISSFVKGTFSIRAILMCFLPTSYFVIFYCVIFFLSPYVNRLLDSLSYKSTLRFVSILAVLFSLHCTFVQILSNIKGAQISGLDSVGLYGSQSGYNIANFLMAYTIGAFLRKYMIKERFTSKWRLAKAFFICAFLIMFWWIGENMITTAVSSNKEIDFFNKTAWIYCNPLVVCEAAIVLLLFLNINIGCSKIINMLSSGVFSVFLLHGHLIRYLGIERFVQGNTFVMCGHIILSACVIIIICTIVHYVYKAVMTPVFNRIFNKKIVVIDLENASDASEHKALPY